MYGTIKRPCPAANNQRYFKNRIQGSYNLLIIFLAADGGWPPAANFILVKNCRVKSCFLRISRYSDHIRRENQQSNTAYAVDL